jgi:hypothetical protein
MSCKVESKGSEVAVAVNGGDRSTGLREHDVVCEKGRGDHERWPGNKLYRYLINLNKESYNDLAPMARSASIGKIISTIKDKNGWFVQRDDKSGEWGELSDEKVRKKVSDDLRREVRRRREKRSSNTMFSAKLRALKEMEDDAAPIRDILEPVNDPRQTDVLFGPGARRHPGNKTYWRLMKMNLDHYIISPYGARSMISRSIVQGIRDQSGRFLEQDPKTAVWYEISDKRAIEKTSHALSNKKYKTRKRHPDEPSVGHPFKGYNDADDEESQCYSDKSTDSPSQESVEGKSHAKKMSKKHRLLERMGGLEFDDDDKESIPHAANILISGFPRRSEALAKKLAPPSSPPRAGTKPQPEERVIISPHDSRSSISGESRDDYHEFEEARGFRRMHRHAPPPVPDAPDAREYLYRKAEIEPRLSRYEAHMEERYLSERMALKSLPPSSFGVRMQEYAPTLRRYVDRGLPSAALEAEYLAPHGHQPLHSPYGAMPARGVLKARGPSGYWGNGWGGSPLARHTEEYSSWR